MIDLYSRSTPDSTFIGSYLSDPDETGSALDLLRDIDAFTYENRDSLLYDYVIEVVNALLERGFYGDDMIYVEHVKEQYNGIRNT